MILVNQIERVRASGYFIKTEYRPFRPCFKKDKKSNREFSFPVTLCSYDLPNF